MGEESLLRSAEMSLIQLYIPSEVAHDTVNELGELGKVQFRDLNPDVNPFQRSFVSDIRRLDEMDRRVRFLYAQMEKEHIPVRPLSDTAPPFFDGRRGPAVVDELDVKLKEHEERIGQMNASYETLQKRLVELEEARHVLRETAVFFQQAQGHHEHIRTSFDDHAPLLESDVERAAFADRTQGEGGYGTFDLEFVAGTIDRVRMPTFERILWRVLRGNLYMNYAELDTPFNDPSSDEPVYKNVFIIFAHGAELLAKIRKISESMGGTLYPIDANEDKRQDALREVTNRIEDLNSVLYSTSTTRKTELVKVAESLSAWATLVRKEKLIYHTLNLFNYDARRKTLIAEGWTPTGDIGKVQAALRKATYSAGISVPTVLQELHTNKQPPTYQRTNKFTEGFQAIIDAYGIATYQEINPGLFTVITFPFLFAVMFGDIGHGFLMFMTAAAMVLWEKKLAKAGLGEIFDMFFYGRYIILLMGAFSIFTGFMYNDIFSKSMHIWHSGWTWPQHNGTVDAIPNGHIYPFGLDPAWHGASNALVFTNSLKMKMSIILGVLHMSFAIFLQVPNFVHFKKTVSIYAEFLPQILFMESIFGYLVVTIIYKWSVDWWAVDKEGNHIHNSPPGLLNMLIYMFLSPGTVEEKDQLYPGQGFVQSALLFLALVCVPWMLFLKPYKMWKEHQKIKGQGYQSIAAVDHSGDHADRREDALFETEDPENGTAMREMDEEQEHEFELGEVLIHQIIHTIEFCLGCISNTASYLRLWALSLAHAQLSEVLWDMTLAGAFGTTGIVGVIFTVIMFAMWFTLTICVLCLMEGLSAFLHALRLHWVEANGKHYMAGGYAFQPLTFKEESAVE